MADFIPAFEAMIEYDKDTGEFYWRVQRGRAIKPGSVVKGTVGNHGYKVIKVDGKLILAHRLAWALSFGSLPEHQIDHINNNKTDNRLCNLRKATASENQWNKRRQTNNSTGFKGVSIHRVTGLFRARLKVFGKEISVGYFRTPELAHAAIEKSRSAQHGEFARS